MSNGHPLTILQNIRRAGQLTRRELAAQLGVGISMVSKLTTELIERGLLHEVGRSTSAGGRPSDLLALNPGAGYALGLDAGGNHLRAAVVDFSGGVVSQIAGPGPDMSNRAAILSSFITMIDQALAAAGLSRADVFGVGVSLYGSVDPTTGTVYSWTETPRLYNTWKNFNVGEGFRSRWQLPHVYVDDVVRTLGLAEMLYGTTSPSQEDFVYILADTGIGAALMIDGKPYVGPSQLAGELGHLPLNNDKVPCSCGNIGCLETIASVHAVVELANRRLNEIQVESTLSGLDRAPKIEDIIAAALAGDKLAYRILTEAGEALGRGIAITLNLFGASRVVAGGVLANSEAYLDAAQRAARMNTLTKVSQSLRFERSVLDEFAAARGAAGIVLNALFQPGETNALALVHPAA
jgi:predicted NBD/HSP70 family sugar kinase